MNSVVILAVRIALVLLLYAFLFFVIRALTRDLRATPVAAPATPRTGAGLPRLMVLAAGQTGYNVGHQFPLRNPTMLGRDPGVDIPVEDEFVSAHHLRLALRGAQWLAEDLGSTNGTRLNGAPLHGVAPLRQGDILDLGRLRLRFTQEP
jgi:hypothetical protein